MLFSEKITPPGKNFNSETELILVVTFEHWLSWRERCFVLLGPTLEKIPLPHLWQIGMKRLHLSRWRCCLATWEKGHSCKGSGCVVWRWAESISTWIIRWIYPSGRSPQEKNAFFRHCSNYLNLPPPVRVSPIRVTCTSFFRHRNSSFGSQFRTKNTTYIQPKNSLMLKLLAFWKK